MRSKVKELRFYFINIIYEVRGGLEFPTNLTIALPRDHWASIGSYIIIVNNYDGEEVYLGKIYNVRRVTTFDSSISIREIIKIELNWENIIRGTQGELARKIISSEYPVLLKTSTSNKIKNAIIKYNKETIRESYFNFKRIVSEKDNPLLTQFVDAFILALSIFGVSSKHMPVVHEEQILNYDLSAIFKEALSYAPICRINDDEYIFNFYNKSLIIKAFHSRQISDCIGIDLIYNFEKEGRTIFIRYECLGSLKNKSLEVDDIYVSEIIQISNAISDIAECYNFKATDLDELRVCKCPIYIKLCSRQIKDYKYAPSGFYYPICVWSRLCQNKAEISFDDNPKLSKHQFLELVQLKLIGSSLNQSKQLMDYLIKNTSDQRLKLIFIETGKATLKD